MNLERDGFHVVQAHNQGEDGGSFLLDLARSLGELYVPVDCDPAEPMIKTAPTGKRQAAPFDRPVSSTSPGPTREVGTLGRGALPP